MRVNTLRLSFQPVKTKPNTVQLHEWLRTTFKLNKDQVISMEFDYNRKVMYLKLLNSVLCANH